MWYDNKGICLKESSIIFIDECGITKMKATPMVHYNKVTFDPFVMLESTIQVFYIKDKLHVGWVLMHESQARVQPVI